MKATTNKVLLLLMLLCSFASGAFTEPIAWPMKIGPTGRYFVDSDGKPVFWLGTTQWELFRGYNLEDARTILEKTASHGFTFVQVKLLGQGDGNRPNVYGHKPLINGDALTPNEAYFENVDAVVQAARENNLAISMSIYHQSYRRYITLEKGRSWAKWLAERYNDSANIVWSSTPEAKQEFVPILRELAAGLREGDRLHRLVTFKPDPAGPSSSFVHDEEWLDFNSMQVWNAVHQIYPMVTKDYSLKPIKPTLMAEAAYEAGSEYGFEVTPLWVRREAYYSYLAGGHHTYGHNDSWRILPTWKQAIDAPGAQQMGILRKIFEARPEWWLLVPDQSLLVSGGQTEGKVLHLAARHQGGKWAMIYLADKADFSVNMDRLSVPQVAAFWVKPESGESVPAGSYSSRGVQSFSTPDGWEDSLLILGAATSIGQHPAFPLKPSEDGRYLEDAKGVPFFVHADTAWQAPKRLSVEDFRYYLTHREKLGFNTVMLHTFSKELTPATNLNGDAPFEPLDDITKPVEAYWQHLDTLLQLAETRGFLVMIAPLWIRWGGSDQHGWRHQLNETNAPVYGGWLGQRYAPRKNIVWILGGDANPNEKTAAINALGRAIKAAAPHHLITVHNAPEHSSARFFGDSDWLDINLAYTYRETPVQVLGEWNRTGKARPIVLGESGYEEESNDHRGGVPWRVRRQAYGAVLSGALGGHAFGQKHLWRMDDRWKAALDSPGSRQMAHVKQLFATRQWWKLRPDERDQFVVAGRGKLGENSYVSAALTEGRDLGIIYLSEGRSITVNLARMTAGEGSGIRARWMDPVSGIFAPVGRSPLENDGPRDFTPPGKNAGGDNDWVLLLEGK